MKKFGTLIFLVFSCFSFYTRAQVLIGPVVGGQMNMFTYDDKSVKSSYSIKPSISYHVGASISFRIQKTFFLHTSFLYNERKKVMDQSIEDASFYNRTINRFIDIPILYTKEIKAKIGKDKYYKWYLGVGPNVSYWLGGKGLLRDGDLNEYGINPPNYQLPYKVTFYNDSEEIGTNDMNIKDPNRFILGLNFSAGVIFEPVEVGKFMLNARFQLGHSFMSENSKGEFGYVGKLNYLDDQRFRNNTLSLSVYYFIDLKTSERKRGKSTIKNRNS